MEGQIEFDRHNRRYKQFKVKNSRRTSTPTPPPRTKYQSIRRDPPVRSALQPPSTCLDVDTTYVSYVQWRHYLVVPNSARKFKVRGWERAPFDSIISGNINMEPARAIVNIINMKKPRNVATKTTKVTKDKQIKTKVEEELNSRIMESDDVKELKGHLERRNQRIMDLVMPMIKRSVKKFVIRNATPSERAASANYTQFLNHFTSNQRNQRHGYDDRARLIDDHDDYEE